MNKPHHTWSDSPIHEQIRDAGLDPVNRTTNDTPTPEIDEHEFPCMTWPSRAHPMVVRSDLARKLERELITVTKQRDSLIKAIEPLEYWRDISECDCSCPLPQGGCLRCDLERILKLTKPKA